MCFVPLQQPRTVASWSAQWLCIITDSSPTAATFKTFVVSHCQTFGVDHVWISQLPEGEKNLCALGNMRTLIKGSWWEIAGGFTVFSVSCPATALGESCAKLTSFFVARYTLNHPVWGELQCHQHFTAHIGVHLVQHGVKGQRRHAATTYLDVFIGMRLNAVWTKLF